MPRTILNITRRLLGAGVLSLALIVTSLAVMTPQSAQAAEAKVVYHVDFADPRRFSGMLTSLNNMVMYYNDHFIDYDVRVVFVSHGVRFVTDDPLAGTPFAEDDRLRDDRDSLRGRLLSLHNLHNVQLEFCDITRTEVGLDTDKVYAGVELIPSGVVRIAELQNDHGFAYIKIE